MASRIIMDVGQIRDAAKSISNIKPAVRRGVVKGFNVIGITLRSKMKARSPAGASSNLVNSHGFVVDGGSFGYVGAHPLLFFKSLNYRFYQSPGP